MTKEKGHEPLFQISKRMEISSAKKWIIRLVAGMLALLVCSLFALIFTKDYGGFYKSIITGNFGSSIMTWGMLQRLAILLCIALALTPAFKMKYWNIGGEGQVLVSCLVCAVCMYYIKNSMSQALLSILCLLLGVVAGMIWAVIPALFKAKWNTNETLFTLMMNYVAMAMVSFFISYAIRSGSGVLGYQQYGHMPKLEIPGLSSSGQGYLLIVILVAVLTILMYVYLRFSKHGYEISVVGESENTARYIGINVKKVIIRTLLLSGAICGFAGWLLVTGVSFTVNENQVGGNGFTAILVSWLAHFNPLAMILTAFLVVFLKQGASQLVTDYKLGTEYIGDVIVGLFFFFIIGCEFFINYKVSIRKRHKKEDTPPAVPEPQLEDVESLKTPTDGENATEVKQ